MRQAGIRETNASESLTTCREFQRRYRNQGGHSVLGGVWRVPAYWPGGVRHGGDVNLICGFCMELGKAGAETAEPGELRAMREGALQTEDP
jgi:hypothetical protein